MMQRITQQPTEAMRRHPISGIPPSSSSSSLHPGSNSSIPDLLWISKQQQQHPSTHAHPLKNTIRLGSNGIRHKFDGKQWRPLCESPDGYECRNLAFRSSLCQKHFYKLHLYKRPYIKSGNHAASLSAMALKRPLSHPFDHHPNEQHDEMYDEENSIQVLDGSELAIAKRDEHDFKQEAQSKFQYFSIDCVSHSHFDEHELSHPDCSPAPKTKRLDSTNNESVHSNESDSTSLVLANPKVTDSLRLGIPPLTRTEEKAIANELMTQLPADASFAMGEQIARRRAGEIILDNYSHQISSFSISLEWFYDFLLRNPRVPIHFQTWFASVKPNLPCSDSLFDIKIWQLGLITRSVIASSSLSSSSSSP